MLEIIKPKCCQKTNKSRFLLLNHTQVAILQGDRKFYISALLQSTLNLQQPVTSLNKQSSNAVAQP